MRSLLHALVRDSGLNLWADEVFWAFSVGGEDRRIVHVPEGSEKAAAFSSAAVYSIFSPCFASEFLGGTCRALSGLCWPEDALSRSRRVSRLLWECLCS